MSDFKGLNELKDDGPTIVYVPEDPDNPGLPLMTRTTYTTEEKTMNLIDRARAFIARLKKKDTYIGTDGYRHYSRDVKRGESVWITPDHIKHE